jgi:dGTPase
LKRELPGFYLEVTYSLEVSVVARSLGRIAGKEVLKRHPHLQEVHGYHPNDFGAIVAAAALAHDIGNPPFGHSGEKAIGHFFETGEGKQYKSELTQTQRCLLGVVQLVQAVLGNPDQLFGSRV